MPLRSLAEAAIAIDPSFAAANALIAFTHLNDYANGYGLDPEGSLRVGRELAERAVSMDDEDPACHMALGAAYSWSRDLVRAEAHARRGLALSPNCRGFHDPVGLRSDLCRRSGRRADDSSTL